MRWGERGRRSVAGVVASMGLGLGAVAALAPGTSWVRPPVAALATRLRSQGGGRLPAGYRRGAAGVLRRHVAYELSLLDGVRGRLSPGDAEAAAGVAGALRMAVPALEDLSRRDRVGSRSAVVRWEAEVGDGSPRPGEATHYACSVGVRRSDAADIAATPDADVAEELASIEMGLLVEGRQLAAAIGHAGGALSAVDGSQRLALQRLAPLLIPSDRPFALSA